MTCGMSLAVSIFLNGRKTCTFSSRKSASSFDKFRKLLSNKSINTEVCLRMKFVLKVT